MTDWMHELCPLWAFWKPSLTLISFIYTSFVCNAVIWQDPWRWERITCGGGQCDCGDVSHGDSCFYLEWHCTLGGGFHCRYSGLHYMVLFSFWYTWSSSYPSHLEKWKIHAVVLHLIGQLGLLVSEAIQLSRKLWRVDTLYEILSNFTESCRLSLSAGVPYLQGPFFGKGELTLISIFWPINHFAPFFVFIIVFNCILWLFEVSSNF